LPSFFPLLPIPIPIPTPNPSVISKPNANKNIRIAFIQERTAAGFFWLVTLVLSEPQINNALEFAMNGLVVRDGGESFCCG
jgi:hypothetical protein